MLRLVPGTYKGGHQWIEQSSTSQTMVQADHCANYNTFSHDPDGRLAYLASLFWGPEYVPPFPCQVFIGLPEPPRYGPPAAYQRQCLPAGWVPTPPPRPTPQPPYLDPLLYFDPELFDGL